MSGGDITAPHPDRQEPRLSVGVISGGAVGTAIAETLRRAGHHIHGIVARSHASQDRLAQRLPGVPRITTADAAQSALVILAVPDTQLLAVTHEVAAVSRPGQIVVHTAGALGCAVLQAVTDTGALPLALHPAMSFTGGPEDTDRLAGCAWGVTVDSDTGAAVAELLVGALGGIPIPIAEEQRTLYHAAMAHGANHVVTAISESLRMLDRALAGPGGLSVPVPNPDSAVLLRNILPAVVDGVLERRMEALTGPTARDDVITVLRHLEALAGLGEEASGLVEAYRSAAQRTARAVGSLDVERAMDGYYPDHPSEKWRD